MADGSIEFSVELDAKNAERELIKLKTDIVRLETQLRAQTKRKTALEEELQAVGRAADEAKAKLAELQQRREALVNPTGDTGLSFADFSVGRKELDAQIKEQAAIVKSLDKDFNKAADAVDKINHEIVNTTLNLEASEEVAGELTKQLANYSGERALEEFEARAERLTRRIGGLIKRVFFFSLITVGLRDVREALGNVIARNSEVSAALSRLKGALLTLAAPVINNVLLPALAATANALTRIVTVAAQFVALLFGQTLSQSQQQAEALWNEAQALDATGKAAKKAGKSLAAFDEIYKISDSGGSSESTATLKPPDFSTSLDNLPGLLRDILVKVAQIRFDFDRGKLAENKDAWLIFLSSLLGAVLGGMFGGLHGTVLGIILGAAIGLVLASIFDKTPDPGLFKNLAITVLLGLLGAILGNLFFPVAGAAIGAAIGVVIGLAISEFTDKTTTAENVLYDAFIRVILVVIGAALGGVFFGVPGAAVGALLGVVIGLSVRSFRDKTGQSWRERVWAIIKNWFRGWLGKAFYALTGDTIEARLGISTDLSATSVKDGTSDSQKSRLKAAAQTILGNLMKKIFGTALSALNLANGIIDLAYTLRTTFSGKSASSSSSGAARAAASNSASLQKAGNMLQSVKVPALAEGAVIPPNSSFLAMLGDQKQGTNIEAPLDTIVQAFRQAMGELGGSRFGQRELVLKIGEREAGRIVVDLFNQETSRVGVTL